MDSTENIVCHLSNRSRKRQIPFNYRRKVIARTGNCGYLKERSLSIPTYYDKIFASSWIDKDHVIVGTKCNKLLEINVQTNLKREIPLMRSPIPRDLPEQSAGVHAIALNPSRSFLATGGINVNDLALYTLPDYEPYAVGEFHHGWLFGISWITDFMLCTGARDGNICLWTIFDINGFSTYEKDCAIYRKTPIEIVNMKDIERIRDIYFSNCSDKLGSIGYGHEKSNANICILDILKNKRPLTKRIIPLPQKEENIVITGHDTSPVFAIGSLRHLMLVDDRDPNLHNITSVQAMEPSQAIRSLSFQGNVITIGASKTNLMFYDIRNKSYLSDNSGAPIKHMLREGYVAETIDWHIHRHELVQSSPSDYISIMTHCYDDSGMRLFTAGGPLALDLIGNYAAIWE